MASSYPRATRNKERSELKQYHQTPARNHYDAGEMIILTDENERNLIIPTKNQYSTLYRINIWKIVQKWETYGRRILPGI